MKEKLVVVKIGGTVLDHPARLTQFLVAFRTIKDSKILIHGGGLKASETLRKIGIEPKMVEGRRITDGQTLEIIQMVYAGLINTNVVAELQALGCNALGLCGADANVIIAQKRPVRSIDYGFVGDITSVNHEVLCGLLKLGFSPVFCSLTHNGKGQILNTNADTIAAEIAVAMTKNFAIELLFCLEKNGVLHNPEDENSLIPQINPVSFEILKGQKIIHAGMIPKIANAFFAVKNGGVSCRILKFSNLGKYIDGIMTGTEVLPD